MKRLNPETNAPFKAGQERPDGKVFLKYKTTNFDKFGYFQEKWVCKEQFQKQRNIRKLWYVKNKEHSKSYSSEYKLKNRAFYTSLERTRQLSKIQRTPNWLTKEQLEEISQFYKMAKELQAIFPWKQHVDHIAPLQGKTVSGLHVPWNLQILSEKMNLEKSNKHME